MSKALNNYQHVQKAKYTPQSIEAENFSKMIGPLATLSASPLMAALHPEQQKQINETISQALSAYQQGHQQQQQSHGLLSRISEMFGHKPNQEQQQPGQMQGQPQNSMGSGQGQIPQQGQDNQIPLLPQQGQGIQAGAKASVEAPFRTSPVKAGSIYQTPGGDVLSAPTAEATANAQSSLTSIQNIKPILKNLITEAKPFLKEGGSLGLARSKISGELRKYGVPQDIRGVIGDEKLAEQHAQFESDMAQTTDQLIGALHLPLGKESTHLIQSIITPQPGECEKGYSNRINREIVRLSKREERAKNTLGGGFNLSKKTMNQQPTGQDNSTAIFVDPQTGKEWPIHASQIEEARKAGLVEAKRA